MPPENLIIDVGFHKGEDTAYFLHKGYNVVAIDADEQLIGQGKKKFESQLREGRLTLLQLAIAEAEGETTFNISSNTLWNSMKKEISNRDNLYQFSTTVRTTTLRHIFERYGVPHYCKIDIEGYDSIALASLADATELPAYLSVESECTGDQKLSDSEASATLELLYKLGYTKFKLVDQASLKVLKPGIRHYTRLNYYLTGIRFRLKKAGLGFLTSTGYNFPAGASGPFGEDLPGSWVNYESARELLLKHRNDYFSLPRSLPYGFWCDWHAGR